MVGSSPHFDKKTMIPAKKTLTFLIFYCITVYSQNNFNLKKSGKMDEPPKKDQWDFVHLKLNDENANILLQSSLYFSSFSKTLQLSRMAEIAMQKKEYSKAITLFDLCQKDSEFMQKSFSREFVWLRKAEAFTFINQPDSAFFYIDRLAKAHTGVEYTHEGKLKIYYLLSINYENLNNSQKAYEFAKMSLSEIAKKKQWDDDSKNFPGGYEQQGIKKLSEETVKENRKNSLLLIALILFSSGSVTFMLGYRYYKKKKEATLVLPQKINIIYNFEAPEKNEKTDHIAIDNELVNRILRKLDTLESSEKFLSNNFKLSHVAKQLNTNTAYLSQIINQHKGVTFSEYTNNLRIDYVLRQLHENSRFCKYTIQTIAEEIGYKSSTTFIKAFKDRVQMTPSDYIKQIENFREYENITI